MASELSYDNNSYLLRNLASGKRIFETHKTRSLSNLSELASSTEFSGPASIKLLAMDNILPSKEDRVEHYNSGRWSDEEHLLFIDAIFTHANDWKSVQAMIKTRSCSQARSHAQKFFIKLKEIQTFCLPMDLSNNPILALHEAGKIASKEELVQARQELLMIHNEKTSLEKPIELRKNSIISLLGEFLVKQQL